MGEVCVMRCKNCKNRFKRRDDDGSLYDWCGMIVDSPDTELERQCKYYSVASNADLIRSMSDEELNKFINGIIFKTDKRNKKIRGTLLQCKFLDWLKEEVSE